MPKVDTINSGDLANLRQVPAVEVTAAIERHKSARDLIRSALLKRISEGVYLPGERLKEMALAREFEVSQAPIREAFRELETLGLDDLRSGILRLLQIEGSSATEGVLNSLRQQEAVTAALEALSRAEVANDAGIPHEFLLADLHSALRALDTLTGQTTSDDILNLIFSTFCIGK